MNVQNGGTAGQQLGDRQIHAYTAADAALTTDKPWELEASSPRLKQMSWVLVVLIMAVHIFMGVTVGIGYTGAAITLIDQFAFVGIGIILSIATVIGLSRPRVRVNEDGIEVRNLIGARFYPWSVVYGLSFPKGTRIARLELPEFEYVPVWALQSADGEKVVKAVSQFRDLEAKYMPKD
ncbi:PH domain-containing protein [Corynebacterium sp. A21]|uniref:PH domain-containing protein n=1 Tax=Corynebacterium sp. A21 TaxID=3457318 RepID=UPI003FD0CBB9